MSVKLLICQLHDSSVCWPTCDVTKNTICQSVCPSPVPSILPSAKFTVKIPMSIPVQKILYAQYMGKVPSVHTSTDLSVDPSGSPSITSSPSAEKPLKVPSNNGEKHVVNYLYEITVKSPSIHTLYGMSVIAPVHALSVPSIHTSYIPPIHTSYILPVITTICASSIEHICTSYITSAIVPICALPVPSICPTDDECQEFLDKFPSTSYGEKLPSKITAKIPDNVTLTLHQAKSPEEAARTTSGVKDPDNFPVT